MGKVLTAVVSVTKIASLSVSVKASSEQYIPQVHFREAAVTY